MITRTMRRAATACALVCAFGPAIQGSGGLRFGCGSRSASRGPRRGPSGGAKTRTGFVGPGTVLAQQEIGSQRGGFSETLGPTDFFGSGLAGLGDVDADGVPDLAVGAVGQVGAAPGRGAIWLLGLNADGTVKSERKILSPEELAGGFVDGDGFGSAIADLGDLDGDGVLDLAVGASGDDDGFVDNEFLGPGALFVLFLNADGSVKASQKISQSVGGFGDTLAPCEFFGRSLANLGDLDGDGAPELAVGGMNGRFWILSLKADGTVKSELRLDDPEPELSGGYGETLGALGDVDGDLIPDLVVGKNGEEPNGALWVAFLNADGTVREQTKIAGTVQSERFGAGLAGLGDVDGDGVRDLAAGAIGSNDCGIDAGAVYLLFLNADGTEKSRQKVSGLVGGISRRPAEGRPVR